MLIVQRSHGRNRQCGHRCLLPLLCGSFYNYLAGEFIEGLEGAASHFEVWKGRIGEGGELRRILDCVLE